MNNYHVKLDTHCDEVTSSILMAAERTTMVVAPPHPDGYNFVQRVRNRLFKRGIIVRSRNFDGNLCMWALDREYTR